MRNIAMSFIIVPLCLAQTSFAQSIIQTKGKAALIDLEGNEFSVGQNLFTLNSAGKRVGQVRVKKIQKNRALADVLRGKVEKGQKVELPKTAGKKTPPSTPPPSEQQEVQADRQEPRETDGSTSAHRSGPIAGALIGYSMNTMKVRSSVNVSGTVTSEDLSLTGSSLSLKGYYDRSLNPTITLRLLGGLEPFEVKGSPTAGREVLCGNTSGCSIKYTYLTAEGQGHVNFVNGKNRIYGGAGYAFMFAMSNSGNVAAFDDSVKTNQVITVILGADFKMSGKGVIPVTLEYGYFPTGGDVRASALYLRAGYGFEF